MDALQLDLLGGFRARTGPGAVLALPTRKTQALLALLAVPAGQTHARNKLAALFWGDMGQKQSRGNLRQALVRLRRSLGDVLRLDGAIHGRRNGACAGRFSAARRGTRRSFPARFATWWPDGSRA